MKFSDQHQAPATLLWEKQPQLPTAYEDVWASEPVWAFLVKRQSSYTCWESDQLLSINPYPTAFPYGNGMVLHFYQQQESSTTKTVHKVINKGLKTYV